MVVGVGYSPRRVDKKIRLNEDQTEKKNCNQDHNQKQNQEDEVEVDQTIVNQGEKSQQKPPTSSDSSEKEFAEGFGLRRRKTSKARFDKRAEEENNNLTRNNIGDDFQAKLFDNNALRTKASLSHVKETKTMKSSFHSSTSSPKKKNSNSSSSLRQNLAPILMVILPFLFLSSFLFVTLQTSSLILLALFFGSLTLSSLYFYRQVQKDIIEKIFLQPGGFEPYLPTIFKDILFQESLVDLYNRPSFQSIPSSTSLRKNPTLSFTEIQFSPEYLKAGLAMLLFRFNEEEQNAILNDLPYAIRHLLLKPGIVHFLPDSLQFYLNPRFTQDTKEKEQLLKLEKDQEEEQIEEEEEKYSSSCYSIDTDRYDMAGIIEIKRGNDQEKRNRSGNNLPSLSALDDYISPSNVERGDYSYLSPSRMSFTSASTLEFDPTIPTSSNRNKIEQCEDVYKHHESLESELEKLNTEDAFQRSFTLEKEKHEMKAMDIDVPLYNEDSSLLLEKNKANDGLRLMSPSSLEDDSNLNDEVENMITNRVRISNILHQIDADPFNTSSLARSRIDIPISQHSYNDKNYKEASKKSISDPPLQTSNHKEPLKSIENCVQRIIKQRSEQYLQENIHEVLKLGDKYLPISRMVDMMLFYDIIKPVDVHSLRGALNLPSLHINSSSTSSLLLQGQRIKKNEQYTNSRGNLIEGKTFDTFEAISTTVQNNLPLVISTISFASIPFFQWRFSKQFRKETMRLLHSGLFATCCSMFVYNLCSLLHRHYEESVKYYRERQDITLRDTLLNQNSKGNEKDATEIKINAEELETSDCLKQKRHNTITFVPSDIEEIENSSTSIAKEKTFKKKNKMFFSSFPKLKQFHIVSFSIFLFFLRTKHFATLRRELKARALKKMLAKK